MSSFTKMQIDTMWKTKHFKKHVRGYLGSAWTCLWVNKSVSHAMSGGAGDI